MTFRQILSCMGLGALLTASAAAAAQEPSLVVENGRVIVGDGTVLERGTVVVAGERILTVTDETVDAPDARRIDASGKTVLPGLVDAHVHLLVAPPDPKAGGPASKSGLRPAPPHAMSDSLVRAYMENGLPEKLRAYLEAGITTVRSTGDYWPEILAVKARLHAGELAGPRLEVVGPVFTAPDGHPSQMCRRQARGNEWCRAHLVVQLEDPGEARAAVRRVVESGVDAVKMVGREHGGLADDKVIRAIAVEAAERGVPASMHVYDPEDAFDALTWGVDQFVHAPVVGSDSALDRRMLDLMHERGVFAVSTISINDVLRTRARQAGRTERAEWQTRRVEELKRAASVYAQEGLLVFGTDVPMLSPGEGLHREVRLLREAGLAPAQILRAATKAAATQLGHARDLGTLEAGKLADLVVVDGNPVEDLSALQDVELVVKGGEVVVEADTEP